MQQDNVAPRTLALTPAASVTFLVAEATAIAARHPRRVAIGLAGGPGVGKSTLAAELVAALNRPQPGVAALLPMDGFHMHHAKLEALGIADAKGAPQTFEAAAFAEFLARLKAAITPVSGPGYSRKIEDVVENAFTVGPGIKILVVEGNYLLLPDPPWDRIKPLLDLAVFIHLPRGKVRARLLERHGDEGLFTAERNIRHVDDIDLANYDLVARSRQRADIAIDLDTAI